MSKNELRAGSSRNLSEKDSVIRMMRVIPYLILASSTEGFSSGVNFLFLGAPADDVDGDCGGGGGAATAGRDAVVGGRPAATTDGDDRPRFAVRISWEDSDN